LVEAASAEAELAFAPSRNLSADSAGDAVAVYGHGFKEIEAACRRDTGAPIPANSCPLTTGFRERNS
jgi:hypothetical protein